MLGVRFDGSGPAFELVLCNPHARHLPDAS